MKKIKKGIACLLSMVFVVTFVLQPLGVNQVKAETSTLSSKIDLSITEETEQQTAVLDNFIHNKYDLSTASDISFKDPQSIANHYIPSGSRCIDVSVLGTVVYFDYILNNVRYVVAYYEDGMIEKTAREYKSDDIYSIDNRSNSIDHMNLNENRIVTSISEDEAIQHMYKMKDEQSALDSVYTLEDITKSSAKVVYPLKYTEDSNTKPYNAKIVNSGNVTINAFSGTKYSTSQPYRVYETMSYHSEVTKKSQAFAVGMTITKIAQAFVSPVNVVKSWLLLANVGFSTANIIQEACQVVEENAYTYLGGKEFGIYDPTVNNTYVETYDTWDQGKIALSWKYNSATGYNSPSWGHVTRSKSLQVANTSIRDSGRNAYNNNILMHGLWRWGVGNGFGY